MFIPVSYEELAEYNKELTKSTKLPVYNIEAVIPEEDLVFYAVTDGRSGHPGLRMLQSRVSPNVPLMEVGLLKLLKIYLSGPIFYFVNVEKFVDMDYEYLYILLNPDNFLENIHGMLPVMRLIGQTDINIGSIIIREWGKGWELVHCSNPKIKVLHLPKFVNRISDGVFQGDTLIEKVTTASDYLYLGNYVFKDAFGLMSVTAAKGIVEFGEMCFTNCGNLWKVTLAEPLPEIPPKTFVGCNSLCNIDIPKSVRTIEDKAFRHCGLHSVELPEQLENLSLTAFDKYALRNNF